MVSFRVREELITYEAAENKKAFTKAGGGGGVLLAPTGHIIYR